MAIDELFVLFRVFRGLVAKLIRPVAMKNTNSTNFRKTYWYVRGFRGVHNIRNFSMRVIMMPVGQQNNAVRFKDFVFQCVDRGFYAQGFQVDDR